MEKNFTLRFLSDNEPSDISTRYCDIRRNPKTTKEHLHFGTKCRDLVILAGEFLLQWTVAGALFIGRHVPNQYLALCITIEEEINKLDEYLHLVREAVKAASRKSTHAIVGHLPRYIPVWDIRCIIFLYAREFDENAFCKNMEEALSSKSIVIRGLINQAFEHFGLTAVF